MAVRKLNNGDWIADFYTVDRSEVKGRTARELEKSSRPSLKQLLLKITPFKKLNLLHG